MRQLLVLFSCFIIASCASNEAAPTGGSTQVDPYAGSGGRFFGTPTWPASFKAERFSSFQVGVTTKAQVVAALGKPDGWVTRPDGSSQLEYAYGGPTTRIGNQSAQQIVYTFFTFDAQKTLTKMEIPGQNGVR
jgi:hypothetical protein